MTRTLPSLKGTSVLSHRGCQCVHFRCHNSEQGLKTYSILNSLRSAWTSLASWYILLMYWMICRYSSRTLESDNWAFFSRGAGLEMTKKKKNKPETKYFFLLHMSCKTFNYCAFHSLSVSSKSAWAAKCKEPAGRAPRLCYTLAKVAGANWDHATIMSVTT